ncbi:hypothetical protein [Prosthecobacter sp.]|uniref:hypothetical protein n=1 Tax=Prosthecobacter sp. TaxID=1965333 RepID=UPI0037837432
MPNQRQSGTKLAGAYISAEKDEALARLAAEKGYTNKADFLRALYDAALAEVKQSPRKARKAAKPGRKK